MRSWCRLVRERATGSPYEINRKRAEKPQTPRAGSVVRGPQHPQVPASCDLARVGHACPAGLGCPPRWTRRFADRVGKRFQVVSAGPCGSGAVQEPDDLPAARRGEALGVLGAQVVAVGFGVGGEGAEDRGRVGVDVRQRRDGGTAASGARTATYRAHDVGRYRTLERAATTPHLAALPCRGVKPPTRVFRDTSLTWGDITVRDTERPCLGRQLAQNTSIGMKSTVVDDPGGIRDRARPWPEWSSCDTSWAGRPASVDAGGRSVPGARAVVAGTTLRQ